MNKSNYQKLFRATLATTVATGAFVAAVPTFTQAEVTKGTSFSDVKDTHQFYEAIMSLTSRGVINGYEDGTYKPGQQISRAHAAKIMALALGLDTKNVVDPGFKDVKKDHPYYGHIAALVNAGIIKGYEDKTFKPTGNLTRAHVAQMLVLGYKLEEDKLSNLPFKDINEKQWFANHIQTLFSNKITSGTTATTFSPNAFVTRGQVASFIFKSEAATKQKGSEVISITADKVVLSDGTFTLPASLKGIFSADNLDFLKGAIVKYTAKDGVITGVSSIEVKASGTAEKNLVIDGQGLVFPGNLTINGDYVHLKNLTIKGAFEVGKEVKNSFTGEKVIVEGTTKVSNNAASTATVQNGVSYSVAATEPTPAVIFVDATFANVEVTKDGAIIEYKGSTKVKEFILSSNVTIKAAAGITIPKVTIQAGATKVTLDANVSSLAVNSTGNLTLAGTGNIKEVTIVSNKDVKFETTGKIDKLSVQSKDTNIALGTTKVGDLVLPAGTTAKDIVEDFDKSTGNIGQIGGVTNPGATPTPPVVTPGNPDDGGTVTPPTKTEQQKLNEKVASLVSTVNNGSQKDHFTITPSSTNTLSVLIKQNTTFLDFMGNGFYTSFINDLGINKINGADPLSLDAINYIEAQLDGATTLYQLDGKTINIPVTVNNGSAINVSFNITFVKQ